MYYLLTVISSVVISVMILFNGKLSNIYGSYFSVIIIHAVGLILITIILLMKKYKFKVKEKLPWYDYVGGVIGYFTAIFNVLAFGKISISAIIALSLFGQMVASFIIDSYGLMGMKKVPVTRSKIIGILITTIGVIFMVRGTEFNFLAIILSFSSGLTIVISRTVNAELSEKANIYVSTWYNYVTGISAAIISFVIISMFLNFDISYVDLFKNNFSISNFWIYTGGILGVISVTLANVCVRKISCVDMTLILFIGQMLTGVAIDYVLSGIFVSQNFIGCIFAIIGLFIYNSDNFKLKNKGNCRI